MALGTVTPLQLMTEGDRNSPRRFRVDPTRASEHAARFGLRHIGPDFEIDSFWPLSGLEEAKIGTWRLLTYLAAPRFASVLAGARGLVVITTDALRTHVPPENALLLTLGDPLETFYAIMHWALQLELFERLDTFTSASAKISPSATISPHVWVADHAEIGPGAVILGNTYVGPGVVIKPNAVIGGDGFATVTLDGRRRITSHAGGVWLNEGAQVGSCTCIDKGLFGDLTVVGRDTLIDNLVHFAHSARAGSGCSIVARAEISGSVTLGNGVWVGPNASINQLLHIDDYCYIGTGSVVTRNLDAHSLAYGSPAKCFARVCQCRTKLSFESDHATCETCGKKYVLMEGAVRRK